jgi:hypothetical protein
MAFVQRRLLSVLVGVVLAILLIGGGLQAQASPHSQAIPQTENASPHCNPCYSFYGSSLSWMSTATSDWFQQNDNWCGVASVRAIQRYDWLYYSNGNSGPGWDDSQTAIYNRMNSATSPWGSGGGYVAEDISRDFGSDPHAIAYAAWYDTPPSSQNEPYWFHNWIYRTSSTTATYDYATDFGANTVSHNDPITATINGGYHSFVISGVYASSDPSYGGESIQSVETWDPWLNSSNQGRHNEKPYNQTQVEVWSLSNWISISFLWGQAYNTYNGFDPDPDTPNHYYVPPFPGGYSYHWGTYYVTIEQDRINNDSTSYDYAIDQNGHLAPHN